MKILFVQPYITHKSVMADTLPGQLAQRGHEVLVSYFGGRSADQVSNMGNLKFYSMPAISFSIPRLMAEFPYFLLFQNVIEEFKPDVIHVNNLPFLTTYQSVRLAKDLKIPSIIQVHGVSAERGFFMNFFQSFYLRLISKRLFGDVSKVVCLTKEDSVEIQNYGCSVDKICIIPNGVDVEKFQPDLACEQTGLILWIGRFVNEKGLDFLIEAVCLLVEMGINDFKLLLIGDGPLKSKIQSQITNKRLEHVVQILQAISHDAVTDYLQQASIFVLPSLKEGMPYSLLEAMACGKAIVGSDISGISSIIVDNENGLLVPAKNAALLSDAISKLLHNKSLRLKIGKNARLSAVEKYDWRKVNLEIEKVYLSIKEQKIPN